MNVAEYKNGFAECWFTYIQVVSTSCFHTVCVVSSIQFTNFKDYYTTVYSNGSVKEIPIRLFVLKHI